MGDLDLSEYTAKIRTGGTQCWYQRLDLTAEQREKLDAALARRDISSPAISRVLEGWGVSQAKPGAVHHHRSGGCTCG